MNLSKSEMAFLFNVPPAERPSACAQLAERLRLSSADARPNRKAQLRLKKAARWDQLAAHFRLTNDKEKFKKAA